MSKNRKSKNINYGYYLMIALCVAIGIAAGIMLPKFFDSLPQSHTTPIALAILAAIGVLSFFISIILHEAGHLVFGLMTGYKFSSFRIGCFMLVMINGKMKLKIHSVAGTGGQCLLIPPEIKNDKMPTFLYNIGGVISNLLFSAMFLILFIFLDINIYLRALFFILFLFNTAFGISNGIPLTTASINNDGKNAISLMQDKEAVRALWIQLKINSECANGKRLSEMPIDWFALPNEDNPENSLTASLISFRISRLMDEGKFDEAEELIKKAKECSAIPGLYKSLMTLDLITVLSLRGADYSEIASCFTKEVHGVINSMRSFPQVIRTKYVFALLAENNPGGAAKSLDLFRKTARSYPYESDIKSEQSIMEFADRIKAERQNREEDY